jgi:hypothetical protein
MIEELFQWEIMKMPNARPPAVVTLNIIEPPEN